MGRSVSFVFTLCCLVFVWMVYDNVYSPLPPIKDLAESIACTAKDCQKHHGATRIDRYFYGQIFEYRWEGSTEPLIVKCSRSSYAFGERECHTQ